MTQEIKFQGFTASPSDYECPDGDLAILSGLIPDEGSLSPVLPPLQLFQLPGGSTVAFIHQTAYIRNYILQYPDNSIRWTTGPDPDSGQLILTDLTDGPDLPSLQGKTIHQVNAIGNTLIILASDGTHYFLWSGDTSGYTYLSNHIPELNLSFGLQSKSYIGRFYKKTLSSYEGGIGFPDTLTREAIVEFSDAMYADFNKTLLSSDFTEGYEPTENEIADSFVFPFFVRYAYRLYDGSLVMPSAPILMPGSTSGPKCFFVNVKRSVGTGGSDTELFYGLHYLYSSLDYCMVNDIKDMLSKWKDIIKSVDIFISKPIYTIVQDGKFSDETFFVRNGLDYRHPYAPSITVSKYRSDTVYKSIENAEAFDQLVIDRMLTTVDGTTVTEVTEPPIYGFGFEQRKAKDIDEDINSCHTFYLLRSIDTNDLATERTIIPVEHGSLLGLTGHETLPDDTASSHDLLIPQFSYGYNARINFGNLRKILFDGFHPSSLFVHTDTTSSANRTHVRIYYYIKQDGKDIIVRSGFADFTATSPYIYLFYPNPNAYKAVMEVIQYGHTNAYYTIPLSVHPTLNGSYFFGGLDYDITSADTVASPPVPSEDPTINVFNKLYTSEVNNPFVFPATGINTIGTGRILSVCTAAKALSQGQFGQFPLYAFTTDGVWAMEVSSTTGGFSAKQPITRDVCINPDSITQLDSAVLFATDRGIMLLSGSTSQCITDTLYYQHRFLPTSLPQFDKLLLRASVTSSQVTLLPFPDFLRGCRSIYSYNLQRIIVYNPTTDYAYLYSLRTKTWGMMPSTIASSVPSYPEALAMLRDNTLVDFSSVSPVFSGSSAESSSTTVPSASPLGSPLIRGILVTRPLKLGDPNQLKTIDTVIQRGQFRRGHVLSALYGSRDLFSWHLVWTSTTHRMGGFRGTPYKFFRVVSVFTLSPDESLFGCTIQYTPRLVNRLR